MPLIHRGDVLEQVEVEDWGRTCWHGFFWETATDMEAVAKET